MLICCPEHVVSPNLHSDKYNIFHYHIWDINDLYLLSSLWTVLLIVVMIFPTRIYMLVLNHWFLLMYNKKKYFGTLNLVPVMKHKTHKLMIWRENRQFWHSIQTLCDTVCCAPMTVIWNPPQPQNNLRTELSWNPFSIFGKPHVTFVHKLKVYY